MSYHYDLHHLVTAAHSDEVSSGRPVVDMVSHAQRLTQRNAGAIPCYGSYQEDRALDRQWNGSYLQQVICEATFPHLASILPSGAVDYFGKAIKQGSISYGPNQGGIQRGPSEATSHMLPPRRGAKPNRAMADRQGIVKRYKRQQPLKRRSKKDIDFKDIRSFSPGYINIVHRNIPFRGRDRDIAIAWMEARANVLEVSFAVECQLFRSKEAVDMGLITAAEAKGHPGILRTKREIIVSLSGDNGQLQYICGLPSCKGACKNVPLSFSTKGARDRHYREEHLKDLTMQMEHSFFKCPRCGHKESVIRPDAVKNHVNRHHGGDEQLLRDIRSATMSTKELKDELGASPSLSAHGSPLELIKAGPWHVQHSLEGATTKADHIIEHGMPTDEEEDSVVRDVLGFPIPPQLFPWEWRYTYETDEVYARQTFWQGRRHTPYPARLDELVETFGRLEYIRGPHPD